MKYIFLLCLLAASASLSNAQIIFTSDELIASFSQQSSQSNFIPASLDGLQVLIDKSGALQTWDFTGIQWKADTTANTSTSTFLSYPGGAALADDTDFAQSSHVMKVVSSLPSDPVIYEFMKINQAGFWILGESKDSLAAKTKILS